MAEAIYSRELQELKEVGGGRRPAGLEPSLPDAALLPFCQSVTSQTRFPFSHWPRQSQREHCCRGRFPRTNGVPILPARGAQEEPRVPRQGCPFSPGTTFRTRPELTGHLQSGLIAGGARRGSDPSWGGRRGKTGREGETRTPGRGAGRPGSCLARSGPAPPASRADPCHS